MIHRIVRERICRDIQRYVAALEYTDTTTTVCAAIQTRTHTRVHLRNQTCIDILTLFAISRSATTDQIITRRVNHRTPEATNERVGHKAVLAQSIHAKSQRNQRTSTVTVWKHAHCLALLGAQDTCGVTEAMNPTRANVGICKPERQIADARSIRHAGPPCTHHFAPVVSSAARFTPECKGLERSRHELKTVTRCTDCGIGCIYIYIYIYPYTGVE